jgi:hypothetical protein
MSAWTLSKTTFNKAINKTRHHNDTQHNSRVLLCRVAFILSGTFKPYMPGVVASNEALSTTRWQYQSQV